jgi:hypothetical protein
MELPIEIWEQIVKKSTKTIEDHIWELDNPSYIFKLVDKLRFRRNEIWRDRKLLFKPNDIVKLDHKDDLFAIFNINYKNDCPLINLIKIRKSDVFGKWGYYEEVDDCFDYYNVMRLKIVEKRVDIDEQLNQYISTLKIDDLIRYNDSTRKQIPLYQMGKIKRINKVSVTLYGGNKISKSNICIYN